MYELIKIEEREGVSTVNARDLWIGLGSKQEFAHWVKGRLEGFTEEVDFTVDKFINGKATQIDYYLTIRTAKHIALRENNHKGEKIRDYFIAIENRARTLSTTPLTGAELIAAGWAEIARQLEAEKMLRVESDKKNALLMHTPKTYTATELAKELKFRSAEVFNQKLNALKIQHFVNGVWVPQADYAELGYYDLKQEIYPSGFSGYTSHFTQKGRAFILNIFSDMFSEESLSRSE